MAEEFVWRGFLNAIADEKYNGDTARVTAEDFKNAFLNFGNMNELSRNDLEFITSDVFSDRPYYLFSSRKDGTTYGIFSQMYDVVIGEKDDKFSMELLKAFLLYYGPHYEVFGGEAKDEILFKLIEKYEDKIFTLVAFDEIKFEEFDRLAVVYMNEYLSNSKLQVNNLERLVQPRFYGNDYYMSSDAASRGGELTLPPEKIEKVDDSLFSSSSSFQRPLISSDEVFTASFEEGSRLTDLKIGTLRESPDSWSIFKGKENSIRTAYNNFFLEFSKRLTLQQNKIVPINITDLRRLFKNTVRQYLASNIKVIVGTGVRNLGFDEGFGTFDMSVQDYLAKKILDDFRYAAWKKTVDQLKDLTDEELAKVKKEDLAAEQFGAGEAAGKNSDVFDRDPNAPADDELTESEIKERQKFLKQCALMTRLDVLAQEHVQSVINRANGTTDFNNKRYYMVKDGDKEQQGTMTKLLLPKADDINEFINIQPSTHAYLLPKLRFFKVFQNGSTLKESEFKFRNFTSSQRANDLRNTSYDKGGDFGIREFSFSFEGATPATAKNDVKARLSMFFQSFDDFINKQPENDFPFVELLLLGDSTTQKKKGSGSVSRFQYQPDYYRVRVDVGWMVPQNGQGDLVSALGDDRYNELKTAIVKTNKSFYLNMIDHTIDFRDDGSVQIDVEYRAYIESSMKGTILDALSSKKTREAFKKTKEDYQKILKSKDCTVEQLGKIRRQLLQIQDLLKKETFQSIMSRLIKNKMMFYKRMDPAQSKKYQKSGFFSGKVRWYKEGKQPSTTANLTEATKGKTYDFGIDFYEENVDNSKDYMYINYFYLGDLLHVITDSLYKDDGVTYVEGYENFKFVLGSLQYEDLFDPKTRLKVINLASIPISAELFFEWFTENIIKPERNSYPIMYFIRDLCKYLIGEILSENCFRTAMDKKLQFHTTNFIGIGDKLSTLLTKNNPVIDLKTQYDLGELPLESDREARVTINEYVNYIMIYVDTPRLSIEGKQGIKEDDGKVGIYHYQIGKPHGLLKKLKFSKTDSKYLREARYFRNGFDGLMQLANVYNVSLDMIGNTLYYPGMEVYVNPLGFMGAKSGQYDPTKGAPNRSVANKLGFGGYHLVTNVESTIAPGRFTTNVTALYHYSGDGDPASLNLGDDAEIRDVDEVKKTSEKSPERKKACDADYNKIINIALNIDDNTLDTYPGIDNYTYGKVTGGGSEIVKPSKRTAAAATSTVPVSTETISESEREGTLDEDGEE